MTESSGGSRPKVYRLPKHITEASRTSVSWMGIAVCVGAVATLWAMGGTEKITLTHVLLPADTQATPPVLPGSSITVQDDRGELVGQLSKMPADIEHGASVDAIAAADQKSGKELMNIIGKY
jgi:hypothetical protein